LIQSSALFWSRRIVCQGLIPFFVSFDVVLLVQSTNCTSSLSKRNDIPD